MYSMCSRYKLQYNYQCGSLYSMYCLCGWNMEEWDLYYYSKYRLYILCSGHHF